MRRMLTGLLDFQKRLGPRIGELAHSQAPELFFITCSDSRVVPHLITSADPGDIFVVRTLGNLIAPADPQGRSVGDVSEASAIEYAVDVLGIRDVAVCGHSNCGAIAALIEGRHHYQQTAPNLVAWLEHAEAAKSKLAAIRGFSAGLTEQDRLSQANVLLQLDHVATYPSVRRRLPGGELRLHALWFDLGRKAMQLFEPEHGRFVVLDAAEIERLLVVDPYLKGRPT